jgi:hypothetical protein
MLWLISIALAGPTKKMDKLLAEGEYVEVVEVGEKYLGKNPDAKDADEVESRLAEASYELARVEDTLEVWRVFTERFPDCVYTSQALEREAVLRWEQIKDSDSIEELVAYQARYPDGPHTFEARSREANLAWEAAEKEDTEFLWGAWIAVYVEDPRLDDGRSRQAQAALRNAQELETADALRDFIEAYPDSALRAEVEAMLLNDFISFETPCTGAPVLICERIDAGEVLKLSWEEAEGRPVTATFVRYGATGTKDLTSAFKAWAGPFQAEAAELAESLQGVQEGTKWTLELPVTLRSPSSSGGYAVLLSDGPNEVLLKLQVTETWGPAKTTTTALYTGSDAVYIGMPGAAPHVVAAVAPGEDVFQDRFVYRFGSAGLQRVDVDQGTVDLLDSSAISGVWASERGLVWERATGEMVSGGEVLPWRRKGSEVAVSPDGDRVALLKSGAELQVRILALDGTLQAEFSAPSAKLGAMRWTPEGLFVLGGPELALVVDPAARTVKPTDFRKAQEAITGVKLPWKVTGAGTLSVETLEDGRLALVVRNGPSQTTAVVLDPSTDWRVGSGCTAVNDIDATWLPDGRIAARLIREHCGDRMNGQLVVVNAAGGTPLLLESHGSGLPDHLLGGWHGGMLLLPDGRALTGSGLDPAPPGVSTASWYVPGLYSLL